MKRQTLRVFTMLSLALALTAVSVVARSSHLKFTTIPFSFTVAGKTLPAGEYSIEQYRSDSDTVWLVQSRDGRDSARFITNAVRTRDTQKKSTLVFRQYGDQYFLAQIWTGGANSGRELVTPKPKDELAKSRTESGSVVLAIGQ